MWLDHGTWENHFRGFYTAECIVEDPLSTGGKVAQLTNFGSLQFNGCDASRGNTDVSATPRNLPKNWHLTEFSIKQGSTLFSLASATSQLVYYVGPSLPGQKPGAPSPTGANRTDPYVNSWQFAATTGADGYTESGTVSVGKPEAFANGLANGGDRASSACSINASTDAVVPIGVALTNTTPGFPNALTAAFIYQGGPAFPPAGSPTPVGIAFEFHFGDGSQCSPVGQTVGIDCPKIIPGRSCTTSGFAILRNYFSPDAPSGNPEGIGVTAITLTGGMTDSQTGAFDSTISFTSFSGPGARVGGALLGSQTNEYEFDLVGQPLGPEVYDAVPPS